MKSCDRCSASQCRPTLNRRGFLPERLPQRRQRRGCWICLLAVRRRPKARGQTRRQRRICQAGGDAHCELARRQLRR